MSADEKKPDRPRGAAPLRPGWILWPLLVTGALIYIGHLLPRGSLGLFLIGVFFLAAASAAFIYRPHPTLIAFGVFLLLQDLLVLNLETSHAAAAGLLKFVDEVLVLLFFLLILGGCCARKKVLYRSRLEIPLLAFVFFSVLGSLLAEVPPGTALIQLFLYLKGFIFFFTLLQLPVDRKTIRRYGGFFAALGLLILLGGLIDLVFPREFRALLGQDPLIEERYGITTVKSIFIHPGIFGWFFAFLSLYCFGYYMTFNRPRYLFLGLLFSVGSFLSMRRRNLVGIAAGLTAGLFRQSLSRKLRYGLIIGVLASGFVILAWSKIEALYRDVVEVYVTYENPRLVARNVLYLTSATIAEEEFPWGAGLGRFGSWMSLVDYSPVYRQYRLDNVYGLTPRDPKYITDTFWPAILGETGVLGTACFIWICAAILFRLSRLIKNSREPLFKAFALGALMIFIEGLFESLAIAVFTSPPIVYFIFGSLGLGFAFSRSAAR